MIIEILESTEEKFPPEAKAGGPYDGELGDIIVLDGSGSSDSDGNLVNYTWELGDRTVSYGEIIKHTYAETGKYGTQKIIR